MPLFDSAYSGNRLLGTGNKKKFVRLAKGAILVLGRGAVRYITLPIFGRLHGCRDRRNICLLGATDIMCLAWIHVVGGLAGPTLFGAL